jgi:hypothetical protein
VGCNDNCCAIVGSIHTPEAPVSISPNTEIAFGTGSDAVCNANALAELTPTKRVMNAPFGLIVCIKCGIRGYVPCEEMHFLS